MSRSLLLFTTFLLILSINLIRSQEDETTTTTDYTTEGYSTTAESQTETSETAIPETTNSETTEIPETTTTLDTLETTTEWVPDPPIRLHFLPVADPSIPHGVLENQNGQKVRKRCRCIEKKVKHKVVNTTYVPLNPVIQLPGSKRKFTCNCSHLKKIKRRI